MSDQHTEELKRAAATGDPDAARRLARKQERADLIPTGYLAIADGAGSITIEKLTLIMYGQPRTIQLPKLMGLDVDNENVRDFAYHPKSQTLRLLASGHREGQVMEFTKDCIFSGTCLSALHISTTDDAIDYVRQLPAGGPITPFESAHRQKSIITHKNLHFIIVTSGDQAHTNGGPIYLEDNAIYTSNTWFGWTKHHDGHATSVPNSPEGLPADSRLARGELCVKNHTQLARAYTPQRRILQEVPLRVLEQLLITAEARGAIDP